MKFLLTVSFIALSFLSTAQSAGNKSSDSTYVYVYRAGQLTGSLSNWWIFVDEQKICKLSNKRFIRVAIKPGKHTISAKLSGVNVFKKETEADIEAERGKNYFVACNVKMSLTRARMEMLEVTQSTGVKQMEGMILDNCQEDAMQ
ncbi:MAG TPA: DUF2846 domain-containing protein [Chitinophagaceae bacterium]|nr:DUF2846 domain-containing protein [Chitinophagaceae bacterium]